MIDVFVQTVPFFALIALGFAAGKRGFFDETATANLTKFVFYFALSAMLFQFSSSLSLDDVLDWKFMFAYFSGTLAVYVLATVIAVRRGKSVEEAAIEAQCSVIGNVGFLGVPMLALLMGPQAVGPIMMVLAVDLIFFGSLVVILITGSREGRISLRTFGPVGRGLLKNPMIVSICFGFMWSALQLPISDPINNFVILLGAAATPGALFAIGASLAFKSAERLQVAGFLSFLKLIVHPLAVGTVAFVATDVDFYTVSVMIAAAALPTAGNVYMIAQHYGVAPQRVSATILISTVFSVISVPLIIGWVGG